MFGEYLNRRCPSENYHICDFVAVSETIWFSYGFIIQSNTKEEVSDWATISFDHISYKEMIPLYEFYIRMKS